MRLRSQHQKVVQKYNTTSGQAPANIRKWKFEDSMSFLISYMKYKGRISTLDIEEHKGGDELEENEQDDTEYEVSVEQISPPPDFHRKREPFQQTSGNSICYCDEIFTQEQKANYR
jgi:hypothetical protein